MSNPLPGPRLPRAADSAAPVPSAPPGIVALAGGWTTVASPPPAAAPRPVFLRAELAAVLAAVLRGYGPS